MTVPRTNRRRRRRRIKTKTLVLLSVMACLLLLVGRGTAQVINQLSCSNNPVLINVAVSTDIAPAIRRIADVFNREQRQADGQCVAVQITAGSPAQAAAEIDGQSPNTSQDHIDAWIPDSSLWVDEARGFAAGANAVVPAGFSVAHSPLLLVMPNALVASKIPMFGKIGWRLLLPRTAGGPVLPSTFRIDLPDPTQNAAGLATLIQVSRMLGTGAPQRVQFAKFAYSSQETGYFDDPASLAVFVGQAAPPINGLPVTITSEQAVLGYDQANPRMPLAASYPTGSSAAYGSPELDYPYVLTTSNQARYAAAKTFGRMLTEPYAQSVIRYAGFRGWAGNGVPDRFPASYGLSHQLLQVATPPGPSDAPHALQAWKTIALSSRDLAMVDTSSFMNVPSNPADPTGPTLEQVTAQTAALGLGLFPDTASVGLWEFAANLKGKLPYKPLVSVGPLTAPLGVAISRRDLLSNYAGTLKANGGPQLALYGSILDAFKYMQRTYQPGHVNTVVVLTSGKENATGDITGPTLVKDLNRLANPARKVVVVIIVFGRSGHFTELQDIAHATGGQAYQITKPSDVGKVFFRAVAHRLCFTNCTGV